MWNNRAQDREVDVEVDELGNTIAPGADDADTDVTAGAGDDDGADGADGDGDGAGTTDEYFTPLGNKRSDDGVVITQADMEDGAVEPAAETSAKETTAAAGEADLEGTAPGSSDAAATIGTQAVASSTAGTAGVGVSEGDGSGAADTHTAAGGDDSDLDNDDDDILNVGLENRSKRAFRDPTATAGVVVSLWQMCIWLRTTWVAHCGVACVALRFPCRVRGRGLLV